MTFRTLIRRSLRFHWRAHLGVVLGAAVGSAALIGALVVGDSVRESLRERALQRLGEIGFALETQDRFFTDGLADRMIMPVAGWEFPTGIVSAFEMQQPIQTLMLTGVAAREDGAARANNVQLMGVAERRLGKRSTVLSRLWPEPMTRSNRESVWVNNALAKQLRLSTGDQLILRIPKRLGTAGDVSISPATTSRLLCASQWTGFSPSPPFSSRFQFARNADATAERFCEPRRLAARRRLEGRVNTLLQTPLYTSSKRLRRAYSSLVASRPQIPGHAPFVPGVVCALGLCDREVGGDAEPELEIAEIPEANLRPTPDRTHLDLVSRRVFLDPPACPRRARRRHQCSTHPHLPRHLAPRRHEHHALLDGHRRRSAVDAGGFARRRNRRQPVARGGFAGEAGR